MGTQHVHAGWGSEDPHGAVVPPIYATSAYAHPSHASLKELFARRREGFAYSRSGNPTTRVLEQRIAALEGGVAGLAVASGQAATTIALCALLEPGTHVVASQRLYGGTTELLADTLIDMGVERTTVDPWDLDAWRDAVRPTTRVFLLESLANPGAEASDLDAISAIAHEHDIAVVVDSTLATPALYRPGDHGADVVVHSATKYLAGHGTTIAGLIVDTGRFDPRRNPERWPRLTRRNQRFGTVFADETGPGCSPLLSYARAKYVTDFGATIPAQSAHAVLLGIETLDLRMDRISSAAHELAAWLRAQRGIRRVNHPSSPGRVDAQIARRDFPRGTAGVFSIDLDGGEAAAEAFCDALRTVTIAVNIGDVRTLVCHPASTTHAHLTPQQRAWCGVEEGTVRLSVGLEDVEDLRTDLSRGLAASGAVSDAAAA